MAEKVVASKKDSEKKPGGRHENDLDLLGKLAKLVQDIPGMDSAPMPPETSPIFPFACKEKPTMKIHDYILRCTRYSNIIFLTFLWKGSDGRARRRWYAR